MAASPARPGRGEPTGRRSLPLVLALPALVGVALAGLASHRGTYLSHDALAYVGMASSAVAGHGLEPPPGSAELGNFPPLFPAVLALGSWLGPAPETVARWLNPVLAGVAAGLVAVAVHRLRGSAAVAVGAGLVVAASPELVTYGSSALSEPLFLVLAVGCAISLGAHRLGPRPATVALAGILAAGATATRYAGLALVVGGAVVVASAGPRPRARRWAALYGAGALAPTVAWLAWVASRTGQATNRPWVLHPPGWDYLERGTVNVAEWVVAVRLPAAAAAVVVAGLAVAGWRALRGADPYRRAALAPMGLCAATYGALVVFYRIFLDVTGRLDDRFLLVLHVAAVVAVAATVPSTLRTRMAGGLRALGGLAPALVVLVAVVSVADGLAWSAGAAADPDRRPGGFGGDLFATSDLLDLAVSLPPGAVVASNAPDVVYFHTGRVAERLPEVTHLLSGRANDDFDVELAELGRRLEASQGAVIYFTAIPARRLGMPDPETLAHRLGLERVADDPAGVAYR